MFIRVSSVGVVLVVANILIAHREKAAKTGETAL